MEDIRKRIRQAMEWLKDNRLFASNRAIAERMGYNPSVVSQVITGKSNVSERFVKSLCGVCPTLNFGWIWSGEGEMLLESPGRKQDFFIEIGEQSKLKPKYEFSSPNNPDQNTGDGDIRNSRSQYQPSYGGKAQD